MPLGTVTKAKDQGNAQVIYRSTAGKTYSAKVEKMSVQPSAPAAPTAATSTTGGTLAAATYSYRLARVVDDVESNVSTAVTQVTTGSTSTVTLTWGADGTAQVFRIYGRVGGSETLITEVAAGSTSWVDTGALTPSGTASPGVMPNTAVHLRILARSGVYQKTIGGVLPATAAKQGHRYYVR
jgi:hypothetical protein